MLSQHYTKLKHFSYKFSFLNNFNWQWFNLYKTKWNVEFGRNKNINVAFLCLTFSTSFAYYSRAVMKDNEFQKKNSGLSSQRKAKNERFQSHCVKVIYRKIIQIEFLWPGICLELDLLIRWLFIGLTREKRTKV